MDDLFRDAGDLAADYAAVDWAGSPLGPVDSWSLALRSAVELTLGTRFPVTLLWGPEFVLVYNTAYVELIADKHPGALGRPAREIFAEIWDTIGPMMEGVRAGGGTTWVERSPLLLDRRGFLEEGWFSYSYSAVRGEGGEGGEIEGVIDITAEHTREVLAERRLELLARLGARLSAVDRVEDLPIVATEVLGADPEDLPAFDVRLAASSSTTGGTGDLPAAPGVRLGTRALALEDVDGRRVAWLPLRTAMPSPSDSAADTALLVVGLSDRLDADEDYQQFLRLVADVLAQSLNRAKALTAEREAASAERRLSEALQRSLLTEPAAPAHLQVAVRYQPAVDQARIGGDWHDSFLLPSGNLAVVIGDVAGHDRFAAAAMGQIRNLLRGIAFALPEPPARVLTALDRSLESLGVDVLATSVLAIVEEIDGAGAGDPALLRWSNAGHPPPLLLRPDGGVEVLSTDPNPLLGLDPSLPRADHEIVLEPGCSVVFYTDGLVERRNQTVDEGIAWTAETIGSRQDPTAEQLCDLILSSQTSGADDDVALLVLRAEPRRDLPPLPEPELTYAADRPTPARTRKHPAAC